MPTLEDYERDYHAGDREEVLANIRKYGTDDRSQWMDKPAEQPNQTVAQQWNTGGRSDYDPNRPTPGGFTAQGVGHGGQWNGMNREQWRDAWMGLGELSPQEADAWLKSHGATQAQGGEKAGRWTTPFGETYDLQIGRGAALANGGKIRTGWTALSGGGGGGIPNGAGNGGGGGDGSGGGGGGDLRNQLIQQLLERSKQSLAVNKDDPTLRAQIDPYAATVERQKRDYLADLAEQAGPGANLRGESRVASERAGQAVGGFGASLIGNEIQARRQEIAGALQQLQGQLTSEQEQALRRELAAMDDATKRLGIDVQRQGLDLDWRKALLQNEQFGRDLGLRSEDRYNYWDAVNRGLL